jgi:predicted RNase H-related nuclease YkuK (DUF458 family)
MENLRNLEIRSDEIREQLREIDLRHRIEDQADVEYTQNLINQKINSAGATKKQKYYEIKNIIITSPTQVGKTNYIVNACVNEIATQKLIVISCDNITAQLVQLKGRFESKGLPVYTTGKLVYSEIEDYLADGKSVVVIILGNDSQIKKLHNFITHLPLHKKPKKYLFFHDEGDMVNKADDLKDLANKLVAKSHRSWVNLMDCLEKSKVEVCRAWVSATPENCSHISRVTGKDIIVLPTPRAYKGVSEHVSWDGSDSAIGVEVERIRLAGSREVILHSADKVNVDQKEKAKSYSQMFNCIAVTYNMKGFKIYKNGAGFRGVTINKLDSISAILEKLTDLGPVIVVGYNLMNRGISFVGTRVDKPMSATVMFCSMGMTSHVVGTVQRFGRVCGTSRPDITRRVVYCSNRMYNDYTAYLGNQQAIFSKLSDPDFDDLTMSEILGKCDVVMKMKNKLDRPALKNVNSDYSDSCSSVSVGSVDMDLDKMRRLINSWRVDGAAGRVGSLFRQMIDCGGKMESGMVRDVIGDSQYNALTSRNQVGEWKLIYIKDGRYHYIKQEAIDYYNSL